MASIVHMYFIVALASSVIANNDHCGTIVQPTEVVVLKHDIAIFTCSASSDLLKQPEIVLDGLHRQNLDDDQSSYEGVTWEKLNTTRNETIYLIFLNTTFLKSDKMDFLCIIQSGKCSKGGHLYVVESLPPKLSPPIVEILNSSAVNISWGSPWSYPVNNYTLTISNSMTNITLFIITTIGNNVIITKDNINDCTLLYVAVFANTDIGSNEVSDSKIFGFPKSLELIETSRIAKYINTTYKDYTCIFINIGVIIPDVCSYDNLTYMFSIINETNNEPIMYQYSNTPNTTLNLKSSSPSENDCFNITVVVISTNAKFKEERSFVLYSNYSISIPIMSSSSSVAIIPTATVHIIDSQSSHIASASTPTSSLSSTFSSSVTIMSTTTVDIIDSQSSHIASASTPTSSLPPTFPTVYITIVVITLLILVTVIVLTLLVAFLGCPNCNNTSEENLIKNDDVQDHSQSNRPKLKDLCDLLAPIAPQYSAIGTALRVPMGTLGLVYSPNTHQDNLRRTLQWWLKNGDKPTINSPVTWDNIISIIEGPVVQNYEVARGMRQFIAKQTTNKEPTKETNPQTGTASNPQRNLNDSDVVQNPLYNNETSENN